jgi:hypothetical protein
LNFAKPQTDAFRAIGAFDVSKLPVNPTDTVVTFTLGTKTYSFKLLSTGTFTSAAADKPFISFGVNIASGSFAIVSSLDDLTSALAGTGVGNVTATKQKVSIPISLSLSGLNSTQTLQAEFTAIQDKVGKINFVLGGIGAPGEGILRIVNGNAVEKLTNVKTVKDVKTGDKVQDIGLVGNITLPNSQTLVKATNGIWRLTVGNYSQDIPTGMMTLGSNSSYSFKDSKAKSGVSQFLYNQKTGAFYLALKAIAAESLDPSGLPVASSAIVSADLAVSFDLDLDGGQKLQASQYLRLKRKDASKTKWVLR